MASRNLPFEIIVFVIIIYMSYFHLFIIRLFCWYKSNSLRVGI